MRTALRQTMLVAIVLTLVGCRGEDPFSVENLMKSLQDTDAGNRLTAVQTLATYGPGAKPAVPLLINSLRDDDADVRVAAAYALAAIGPDAEAALPELTEALKRDDA